jgi:DNA helicase-2/ATP-dependent DNA helicase PcrA
MIDDSPFRSPEITDDDIRWACGVLQLPAYAFSGNDGTDPRLSALKSIESMDIAACPGSGKTTLLVAKLAILADKWQDRTRGICVLSHTNVARRQIEDRLGNTAAGRRLLSYPHFIGTIHGFVNEFLAIPWLRALGYPIKMIDRETCQRRRWCKVPFKWRYPLEKQHIDESSISIRDAEFGLEKRNGKLPFGENTPTYREFQAAFRDVALEGYHCFDDMFVWAQDLLDKKPGVVEILRNRFPMFFLDEAQDNSEVQSHMLHRVFRSETPSVVCQRYGDENQAIFDSVRGKGASTDLFPGKEREDLPSSHRFGQAIADLANPLGIKPHDLKGEGPKYRLASGAEGRHTVFLFDDGDAKCILPAYGKLLLATFTEQELRKGSFVAIGQIHRPKEDGASKEPHHVGDYWPEYDPDLAKADPKPESMIQHVFVGLARAAAAGEAFPAVEMIAGGVVRLAEMASGSAALPRRSNRHRQLLHLLEDKPTAHSLFRIMVSRIAAKKRVPTQQSWDRRWSAAIRRIAEAIAGVALLGEEVEAFLRWHEPQAPSSFPGGAKLSRENVYAFPQNDPKVHIRVGSIHSVKGETHSAVLVLETFYQKHNLESLVPWLLGKCSGAGNAPERQKGRLKLHYVAMTRSAHLLCLAMKTSSFTDKTGSLDEAKISALRERGWHVQVLSRRNPETRAKG